MCPTGDRKILFVVLVDLPYNVHEKKMGIYVYAGDGIVRAALAHLLY